MEGNAFSTAIATLLTALTLLGSIVSVYISLISKIHTIEGNLKHIEYTVTILKEHTQQYESGIDNIDNAIVRIDKSLDLHTQQYISDKDIALSHRHSLQELIQHRSSRLDLEISKVEHELKTDVGMLATGTNQQLRDIDKQIEDIVGFLIKRLEFNDRKRDT